MTKKIWGGRFKGKTNPAFEYFSSSVSEDHKLAVCDLHASAAHCKMLAKIGILAPAASRKILAALAKIEKDLARREREFLERTHEDIHSFIESELVRLAGPEAKKIHTARSRNDQVNQATRMYCKDAATDLARLISEVQIAILAQARRNKDLVVPGYTHLQKAQPILLAHQFLSYVEALERSKAQLADALKRIDVLTLGSGALAGTSIPIDREAVRKELGFASISSNSLDAVGSRDFAAEFVFVLALLAVNLSRVAEDFLIGQMEEHGWYEIPEELCTGSSMMPQKRNPDFLELARGAASILIGNATSLLALMKGLPGSYNRDLQWDKRPLFESRELVTQILYLYRVFFEGLKVNAAKASAGAKNDALCATDLAEHLVRKGMAFRDAHEKVGELALYCAERKIALRAAPSDVTSRIFGKLAAGIREALDPQRSVQAKKSYGSTSPAEVARQFKEWEKRLKNAPLHV